MLRTNALRAAAVFATLALLGCGQQGGNASSDVITIAAVGPITGSEAANGEQMRRGAEKAVEKINAAGGVLGKPLKLLIGDDACDPKQAVSVANDMAAQGAVLAVGHFCSASSIPASAVYNDNGMIQISPASTNPLFTDQGLPNVFRVCGRDDEQGPTAANYVLEHFAGKRVAIVDDKSTYGKGLADEFRKAFNAKGGKEVLNESITAGEKDYSPLVSKLKQASADYVFFGGYKTEGGLIVRQMHEQGLATVLIGGDGIATEEFWAITGEAGAGTLMTFGPDPRLIPGNENLVKEFRDGGYEPEAYTLYSYAAVQAWAQAVEKAGATDAAKVAAALKSNQFQTVLGNLGFDAKGDVAAPGYVVYVWKDGKYSYAAP